MSDDKLQKSESAISVASNIGEAIERAVEKNNDVAQTGKSAVTVWPGMSDVCKCGHTYSQHNYSDSLTSPDDPLGFCYECRGGGFEDTDMVLLPKCSCKQFEFAEPSRASVVGADVDKIRWALGRNDRCIDDPDQVAGVHNCPGSMRIAGEETIYCKCACSNCLTATRKVRDINEGAGRGIFAGNNETRTTVFTDDRTCIAFGPLGGDHRGCPVIDNSMGKPIVCTCDCKDCKRKWFSDGRPVVRNGKIVRDNEGVLRSPSPTVRRTANLDVLREKNDPADMVKIDEVFVPAGPPFENRSKNDMTAGPAIPFTVESLNPVLRVKGERKIEGPLGQMMDLPAPLSEQSEGRLWRAGEIAQPGVIGEMLPRVPPAADPLEWVRALDDNDKPAVPGRVPAGEMTARVNSVKVVKDKNGKPHLAMEMTVVQTGEVVRSMMPAAESPDENPNELRDLISGLVESGTEVPFPFEKREVGEDEEDAGAVIGPPKPTCDARGMDGVIDVGCRLPLGHKGTHKAVPLWLGRRPLEWS